MPRVAPRALMHGSDPEGSAIVGPRIAAARARALARSFGVLNGRLTGRTLRDACRLSSAGERRVVALADLERASGRGTERLLRVARTIADLDDALSVAEAHLDEAAWFRPADMRLAAAEVI
jgi:magnesium chelatase family protein